jgi:hypothetical protein
LQEQSAEPSSFPSSTATPNFYDVLFIVSSSSSLTPQETLKKKQMVEWNLLIHILDASVSQVVMNEKVALSQSVYISEDVNPSTLGTKLIAASIGVVSEVFGLVDEFKMARTQTLLSGANLKISNNTHFITADIEKTGILSISPDPLSLGSMNPCSSKVVLSSSTSSTANTFSTWGSTTSASSSSSSSTTTASSTYDCAQGLRTLGTNNVTDNPALVIISKNGTLIDGSLAAGRRVFLPWSNIQNFSNMNKNGRSLMLRSIQWAMGFGDD